MKIVLATGIYPPDIGGPATYVENLARELSAKGDSVTVVTYGIENEEWRMKNQWNVLSVSKDGGPIARWRRYADVLRAQASDADVVIAFSSVSAGVPLMMAKLQKPKKVLRLGGDFFWERYTDRGGMMTLREWHTSRGSIGWRMIMRRILRSFDHVVYSTEFQKNIHSAVYALPPHSVLSNTEYMSHRVTSASHPHDPFRLLFMGRFVGFKNLHNLIRSMTILSDSCLTLVGDGPLQKELEALVQSLHLQDRVNFHSSVDGEKKQKIFNEHDLFVLPSLTEISPHVAAEAAAAGLHVLLTKETGLLSVEKGGMTLALLREPEDIAAAVRDRGSLVPEPGSSSIQRSWSDVAADWHTLFHTLSA